MIAPESIQEVMNRADIIDVVGQFVRLKKRGANHIANCPFHNEKTPSFSVSGSKGIYKCFGCGKGGNVVTFVQEHEKLTYPEAVRWLADYYNIELVESEQSPEQKEKQLAEESLRILNEYAATYFNDTLLNDEEGQTIGLSYFKERGFRKDIIDRFRLGYCPERNNMFLYHALKKGYSQELMEKAGLVKTKNGSTYDAYRGRVIFPIQNMTGRVLGFGARILKKTDRAPKYVNSPENELYTKSRVLYGMYQSKQAISKQDECFMVEGYTDVISLHQGGVENVVASSGTSLTEDQLRLVGQLTKNLTILYDGDAAGVKAALRGLDMALSQSFNVKLVLLPEGADPDSFIQENGAAKFHEYVKDNKQDIISFRMEVGMRDVGNDPVLKSKLVNEIAESISRIDKVNDFALKEHYIRLASTKLQVQDAGFINLVNKYTRERIEQERRQKRNEEQRKASEPPIEALEYETEEQELPSEQVSRDAEQEWALVKALIEHGDKQYEENTSVAFLIHERVDPELIDTPLARRFFDLYFEYLNDTQKIPTLGFFVGHADEVVQKKTADIFQTKGLSHNWKERHNIDTLDGELNYINEVNSPLLYFEVKKLRMIMTTLHERIGKEKDEKRLEVMMKKYMELKVEEKEMTQAYGTAILKLK